MKQDFLVRQPTISQNTPPFLCHSDPKDKSAKMQLLSKKSLSMINAAFQYNREQVSPGILHFSKFF